MTSVNAPPQPWPILEEKELFHTPIFSLRHRRARSPRTLQGGDFYILDLPDWVNVVAVQDDDHIVIIKQYRHGTRDLTLEIPGGLIDPTDTDPRAAAARELREETGYEAEHLELLGTVTPNPAIQNNRCHTYLATGLQLRGAQSLDPNEDIEVLSLSREEIPGLIRSGAISHALVVAAFAFYFGLKGEATSPLSESSPSPEVSHER